MASAPKSVVKKETKAVSNEENLPAVAPIVSDQLPAYLKNMNAGSAADNFDASDVVIPRIKLLQGISPEVEAFDTAKTGLFWHSGMDIPLGSSIMFVIADRRKKYLLSAPMEDGQGVLARADDAKTWNRKGVWNVKIKGVKNPVPWEITDLDVAKSGLTNWGTFNPADEDSPPAATLFYDYLVYMPEHLELGPAVISLARSNIRQAKKGLNDKIQMHKNNGRPMQGLVFLAESFDDQADGQAFKNWRFKSAGFLQDEKLFKMAVDLQGFLGRVRIADEGEVGQSDPTGGDDGQGNF